MHDILGVGNAICDILVKVEDEVLQKFDLSKGSMSLFDEERILQILSFLQENNYHFTLCSGGSVANSINYLSQYGLDVAFLGNVSDGFYGQKFHQELQNANIKFYNANQQKNIGSAKCVILVTEDGERTMCTSLGCAADLSVDNIDLNQFVNSKYIYIEGYLWDSANAVNTIQTIVQQNLNSKIIFSLSDAFCVARHHQDFQNFIYNHVDILFANEAEICALFAFDEINNENLLLIKKTLSDIKTKQIIITRHDKGCIVVTDKNIATIKTEAKKAIDTTGAGDSFAAGYLYGLSCALDIETSANIANYIAGQVVSHLGARPEITLPKVNLEGNDYDKNNNN